jgi:RNAse (barnase) inhibitor barstar
MWREQDPGIVVLSATDTGTLAELAPPQGLLAVARIDGASATDADGLFDQLSQAFRFPAYFGWNWDALSECLGDLQWLPADRYLVVIEHPKQLLLKDKSERKIFFNILKRASREWASSLGKPPGSKISFRTICFVDDGDIDQLLTEVGDNS